MDEFFTNLIERAAHYEQFEQIERVWGPTYKIKVDHETARHISNVNVGAE
jgi:hypothetical protein